MPIKICQKGHKFEKTSDCPVCPICSSEKMGKKYGQEFLGIGAPALRAISSLGITKLSNLTKYSEEELLVLHGFGPKALNTLKKALKKMGKSFRNG